MEHPNNFNDSTPVEGHFYPPVPTFIATESADDLRDRLDSIYSKAFAKAPKPAQFAKLMAEAKQVYDRWAATVDDDNLSCFTQDIADKTDLNLWTVQRLVKRGRDVHQDVLDLVAQHARLNKGFVLTRIAQVDGREAQIAAFEALKSEIGQSKISTPEERAEAFLKKLDNEPKTVRNIVAALIGDRIKKGEV